MLIKSSFLCYSSLKRTSQKTLSRLAAHRKSLHGHLVNDLLRVGKTIRLEKTSFRGWQKVFGKSVARSAPGMFSTHLKRIVAKTGGTPSRSQHIPDQTDPVLSWG